MRTIVEVLDRAKKVQKVSSDYKLALCIGIGESSLSAYRKGKNLPGPKTCAKLAIAMGEDPILLMVEMQAQMAKDDDERSMWATAVKRLQMGVASVVLMSLLAIVSVAGSALPAWATGLITLKSAESSVYYVNYGLDRLCHLFNLFVIFGKFASVFGFSGKKYGLGVPNVPRQPYAAA